MGFVGQYTFAPSIMDIGMKKIGCLIVLFVLFSVFACAQVRYEGILLDHSTKQPVAFANILLPELGRGTVSSIQGTFSIEIAKLDSTSLQVSCIGYEPLTKVIQHADGFSTLYLRPKSQSISEVSVIAEEKLSLETTSTISREALQHLQPSSFADVLELLPGGSAAKLDMSGMQMISLREANTGANPDYNTSFGTAFIIDGHTISNDAQIQDVTGYQEHGGLDVKHTNTTAKGIDMRLIPTDNIESVEIIRGIPSVKYGDLTSGAVIINRSHQKSQYLGRYKSMPGSKLFALSKGFQLGRANTFNVNVDYLDYMDDPRNLKKNYNRLTGSVRYQKKMVRDDREIHIQANVDYTGSFDEKRLDPEADHPETDAFEDKYNRYQAGGRFKLQKLDRHWFKGIEFSLTSHYTHTQKQIKRAVVGGMLPITTSRDEGEHYGQFLPGTYVSNYKNDGKPFYFSAYLNSEYMPSFFGVQHNILLGADWRYDKNYGAGEIYDETRPLYVGVGRPRALKEVPAIQKLALYVEDNFEIPVSTHKLIVQLGLRANASLNMDKRYVINNKPYYDPRLNAAWLFPTFKLFNKNSILRINGGIGWQTKFPALAHLYPQLVYYDKVQLNYYSPNPQLRQVHYKTWITDPVNFKLEPNRNKKVELGFSLNIDQMQLRVTAYHEKSDQGFKKLSHIRVLQYKLYDNETGPSAEELTAPPTIDMFEAEDRKVFWPYDQSENGALEIKKGIEYQLDMGRIEAIQSRVSINGAYFYNKYELAQGQYMRGENVTINDRDIPYYGYYIWDKGKTYEQFNTNVRFDTQIDQLGLIFSSSIENMWFTKRENNYNDGMPQYYYSYDQVAHTYLPEHKDDPILGFLHYNWQPAYFNNERVPYQAELNLKVTKFIGEHLRLAFYVNNMLRYAPDYKTSWGYKKNRRVNPDFGMELNIKL